MDRSLTHDLIAMVVVYVATVLLVMALDCLVEFVKPTTREGER